MWISDSEWTITTTYYYFRPMRTLYPVCSYAWLFVYGSRCNICEWVGNLVRWMLCLGLLWLCSAIQLSDCLCIHISHTHASHNGAHVCLSCIFEWKLFVRYLSGKQKAKWTEKRRRTSDEKHYGFSINTIYDIRGHFMFHILYLLQATLLKMETEENVWNEFSLTKLIW